MEPFRILTGLVAPLDRANVDTDAIIPKQFLKSVRRSGFGPNLFDAWRYLDHDETGKNTAERRPNPDFALNEPRKSCSRGATSVAAARASTLPGRSATMDSGRSSHRRSPIFSSIIASRM